MRRGRWVPRYRRGSLAALLPVARFFAEYVEGEGVGKAPNTANTPRCATTASQRILLHLVEPFQLYQYKSLELPYPCSTTEDHLVR